MPHPRLAHLTALVAAAWLSLAPAALADAPAGRKLELIYTGMTGGLSSGSYDFSELTPLFNGPGPRDFEVGGYVQDNVFRHGDFLLYTAQGPLTLEDFQAFFAAGPVEIKRQGTQSLIASDYGFVLQPAESDSPWLLHWLTGALKASGRYPDARAAEGTRYQVMNRAGLTLSLLSLNGDSPTLELLEIPSRWEMLPAVAVAARRPEGQTRLMAVARPLGDGLRRAWLMNHMREGKADRVLTVDLGNLLDPGFSELSRQQREFTFLQLDRLGYDAMVPAETELSLPPADWERLAARVPMLAANLTPNDPAAPRLPAYKIQTVDGLKVALIGVVDDVVLTREGAAGPGLAWTATDPVAAANAAMAQLAAQAPDAVLLLTNVRDDRLQQFRHIPGITAIMADFQGLPGQSFVESATHSGMNRLRVATAYMIVNSSRNRVGRLTAEFEQPEGKPPSLTKLTNEAELVTDRLPYDEQWRWQLNLTQDHYQATRRALVLPDLREAIAALPQFKRAEHDSSLPRIEWQLWSRVVANVLREATGAEVGIARQMPMRQYTVGPVSQLTVEGWLETGDRLVQTTLSGAALKALATKDATGRLLTFSGYDPVNQKIHGYALVDTELYRVTTTDQVVRHALFAETFAKRPLEARWLRHPDGWARPYAEGERPELREIVLSFLKALKEAHGGAFSPAYMADYGRLLATGDQFTAPRWTVSLDDGQLLLNSYQNQNIAPFSQVRNTRVNTPSSFALGGKGRLAVVYDSRDLAWENRAKSIYRRATLAKDGVEVTQETDDEIVLTSELRLKALQIPLAAQPFPLLPFVNANYATEFTPGQANGVDKPRRAELNAITGLILNPGWGIKELRAGAVLKNDLANPGALEPGFQAVAIYEQKLSEAWPAVLRGGIDVTRYMNTPTDTPDRLGLLADFTAGLTVPLWDRFNFTLSADYFMFQGKVPTTDVLGTSLDFKVGIGYSLGFKPFYGVWF
jgi:2',3'-cyclic-nucleotide 2'-phosphodiesterase (5'-nucleotidase family)